ncbi:MAG: GlsB/YeaQ/YmgE family stress response membrane protein [Bacteroidota bacterium]
MGNLIYWILLGLAAGALAKFLMPGKDPGGWIITILLGIAGSVVGGFLGGLVGIASSNMIGSLLIATGGAVVILILYRYFNKGKA